MNPTIPRILTKLQAVRREYPPSFGKEKHCFILEKPVSEERVSAFETNYSIRLPEGFREFILHAGEYGAGPYYGLLPMQNWFEWQEGAPTNAAAECPMWPGMPDGPEAGLDFDQLLRGTITIVECGCSYFTVLIVSGEHRGRVVNIGLDADLLRFSGDADFLSWYERWLDELLWGWDTTWFGQGMPGDASKILQVLQSDQSSPHDRREALRTVMRMPQLDAGLTEAVSACLESRDHDILSFAVYILGKNRVAAAATQIETLCRSEHANVRRVSLNALKDLEASMWPLRAQEALKDNVEDVSFAALCLLLKSKRLTKELLEPLINDEQVHIRRHAIWAWGEMGFKVSDARWLAARIDDPDREVRRSVILAAAEAKDAQFLPFLKDMAKRESGEFDTLVFNVGRRLRSEASFGWLKRLWK